MGRYVLLALLLLPAAEIAAFYAVASAVGFLQALVLFLGTSLIGLAILRRNGIARILALHRARDGAAPALELQAAGMVVVVAGALLVLPGFISDAVGLLLLLAPRAISRALLNRVFGVRPGPGRPSGVVDLEPDEWEQMPDRPIEHRRRRDS